MNMNERRVSWSGYWKSGAMHSCASSYANNYDGCVAGFWRQAAATLPSQARVLDLAAGNGALGRLLVSQRTDIAGVDAVDLADVASDPAIASSGIKFWPGTSIEQLPFEQAQFDLVASQFGLEYAQWPLAIQEAARVCRPGGRVAAVMHHRESVIVAVGLEEATHHKQLLAEDGLIHTALELVPWLGYMRGRPENGTHTLQAGMARNRYNQAMHEVGSAIEASRAPDLLLQVRDWVHARVARVTQQSVQATEVELRGLLSAIREASFRTSEMLECARDKAGLDAFCRDLENAASVDNIAVHELRQEQGVIGWAVSAELAA